MRREWKALWISIIIASILTAFIGFIGFRLDNIELLPDTGASWYYWKLPNRQFIPTLTAWVFYLIHQITIWICIYRLQFKDKKNRWKLNIALLSLNLFFVLLRILQTHIWYDGLAQDVPVFSSQGSVIIMLVLILIMENKRRGIIFGKKLKGFNSIQSFIKKYHGYLISWAIVYTFWYHPTINTPGHLFGFFYMFLLMIQMSLAYTRVHMNKYWMFLLEVLVLFHGTAVAVLQNGNMWPMFCFGFGLLAVLTQLYGLGLKTYQRRFIQGLYVVGIILVFGGFTGHRVITDIHQITWIPIIEYALVFIFLIVGELLMKLRKV